MALGNALSGGAAGAGIGMAFGPAAPIAAPIGAVLGFVGGLFSGGNDDAQKIAEAQLAEARQNRGLAMGAAAPTIGELNMMSSQLQQYTQQYNYMSQELQRTQKLLDSIDPNIMESSRQVHNMLTGGKSAWMAPVERERERGRQVLEAKLSNTLGAGYAGTTAGQQALNEFDRQTGELLSQSQLQGISQLSQVGQAYSGMAGQASGQYSQAAALTGQLGSNYMASQGSLSNRMVNAINATPTTPYAGAQFTGGYLSNLQTQNAIGQLGNAAVGYGMYKGLMSSPNPAGIESIGSIPGISDLGDQSSNAMHLAIGSNPLKALPGPATNYVWGRS